MHESKPASERREQVKQVDQIRKAEKITIGEACDRVGMKTSLYAYYKYKGGHQPKATMTVKPDTIRKRAYRKKKKISVSEIEIAPVTKQGMAFMFMGSPQHLAEFARSYEQA